MCGATPDWDRNAFVRVMVAMIIESIIIVIPIILLHHVIFVKWPALLQI